MKRKIIQIDEDKCIGCGECIPDCPEGAIQLIDGKARLISDIFCDGLGACIGTCPEGAISVIEREAQPYDERTVMENIARQGMPVIKAHLEHLASHGLTDLHGQAVAYLKEHNIPVPGSARAGHGNFGGCPGSAARSIPRKTRTTSTGPTEKPQSELRQWPVQLKLLNPAAPYFDDADLLIAADCAPFAHAGFHEEFLRGRILAIFCPKLDSDIDGYISKLAELFKLHNIRSISVVHMEVPCCSGVRSVVDRALERSGKKIPVSETTITIEGDVE
jgi:NAD-dependent dihydropyrimidine dehydrogenase PreA subunit